MLFSQLCPPTDGLDQRWMWLDGIIECNIQKDLLSTQVNHHYVL